MFACESSIFVGIGSTVTSQMSKTSSWPATLTVISVLPGATARTLPCESTSATRLFSDSYISVPSELAGMFASITPVMPAPSVSSAGSTVTDSGTASTRSVQLSVSPL